MKKFAPLLALALLVLLMSACQTKSPLGSIERLSPALDSIVAPGATVEVLADGFDWSEGPLWLETENAVIFSDVPRNTIYQWTERGGIQVYLRPSGLTDTTAKGEGSNGLLLDNNGKLVLCQHGDRRLARMNTDLSHPLPDFTTLADDYDGKRLNSPNDAVVLGQDFYFTDPPYGFELDENDPAKELPFQGVYRVNPNDAVQLLVDSLTKPNGLAFFPDGKTLLVANSDPARARWYVYTFEQDSLRTGRVFYDATTAEGPGLPDGLKIDKRGTVFATGPGGVWIFDSSGQVLGKITLPVSAANCALADDDKTLYITADMYLLRVKLRS